MPAAIHFLYLQAWQDLLLARLTSQSPVPDLQVYFVTWDNSQVSRIKGGGGGGSGVILDE